MNRQETAQLLTLAALVDNRTVTPEAVLAWHGIIGHLPYNDAAAALRSHYQGSTEWVMPAHIVGILRDRQRAATRALTMSPMAPDSCERGAHRRLPDGTCLYCTHREGRDE